MRKWSCLMKTELKGTGSGDTVSSGKAQGDGFIIPLPAADVSLSTVVDVFSEEAAGLDSDSAEEEEVAGRTSA